MLKSHKNRLFATIQEAGLDLSNFTLEETPKEVVIKLRDSPLRFVLNRSGGSFEHYNLMFVPFKPGFRLISPTPEEQHYGWTIDDILPYFIDWLRIDVSSCLADLNTPDLWAQAETFAAFSRSGAISPEDLQPFADREKAQIADGINRFQGIIAEEFSPTPEQLAAINERLDYLSKAVDRLNRFDWKALAISTLISISVNLAIDTETGRRLMQLFLQAIGFITGHLPPAS